MTWKGFSILAMDQDRTRLKRVEENAKRTRTEIRILENESDLTKQEIDAIWIDAPCSGSGILRRHPDVRWIRKESDLEMLRKTQRGLLEDAFAKLPPGGILFFSVCSLFQDEGRAHVEQLGWTEVGGPMRILDEVLLTPDGTPSTDGFYGVALQKSEY